MDKYNSVEIDNSIWKPVLIYLLFGMSWIFFSDRLLGYFVELGIFYEVLQTLKGFAYVFITAIVLYIIIKGHNLKNITLIKQKIEDNEKLGEMNVERQAQIHELKRLASELIEQKSFVDELYNSSNVVMIMWDINGQIIEINNYFSEVFGYGDEIIGQNWIEIMVPNSEIDIITQMVRNVKKQHKSLKHEICLLSKERKTLTIILNTSMIYNPTIDDIVFMSFGSNTTLEREGDKDGILEQIRKELDYALVNNEFYLKFQPIYNLKEGLLVGIETLIRWDNSCYSTEEFISYAEKTRQIIRIDRWVIRETFKFIKNNSINSFSITTSINLSAQAFKSVDLIDYLEMQLETYKINPKLIKLEITEHSFMEDIENAHKIIERLKEIGFTIALDDFGTRYSSLNYLGKLSIDVLKIDKSYIDNICVKANDRIIANQVIELCNKLGLTVIAEGIESREQEEELIKMGCNFGQGYLMSRPVGEGAILELL